MAKSWIAKNTKSKRKKYGFSAKTKRLARIRQENLCGYCGSNYRGKTIHAHHIIIVRMSCLSKVAPYSSVMNSLENCVILCAACHRNEAHGGNYFLGKVALPKDFPYSHGEKHNTENFAKHKIWATAIELKRRSGACLFFSQRGGQYREDS